MADGDDPSKATPRAAFAKNATHLVMNSSAEMEPVRLLRARNDKPECLLVDADGFTFYCDPEFLEPLPR